MTTVLSDSALYAMRQKARVIQLLDAAERASITPIRAARLHAFAYLADVLSPVWDLPPFDGKILKTEGGPHYPDLQRELDRLVVVGLAQVLDVQYIPLKTGGARVDGLYSLNLSSPELPPILTALGTRGREQSLDIMDCEVHAFLVELAGAVATVADDDVNTAATVDATYADHRIDVSNVVDFGSWTTDPYRDNLSQRTADRFRKFLPQGALLAPGEKLFLYASFLGGRIHGR
jgi:hypothetical protein